MIPPIIKVCGIRNPDNLAQLLELKPQWVGFIFHPGSPRYVGDDFPVSTLLMGKETVKTGVFVNMSVAQVREKVIRYNLDAVQLHGNETPMECLLHKLYGTKVIKAFQVDEHFNFNSLKNYQESTDYFLFDTQGRQYGGSGKKFNWEILKNYTMDKPYFLSGGIGPDDVERISQLNNPKPYAIDINSSFETAPGIKNIKSIEQFITAIRDIKSLKHR
jgi:phosphoribosylanthranilate isomerase